MYEPYGVLPLVDVSDFCEPGTMRECWFCGDPVDAGQVHRVELEGGHGPRTVRIPGCADCLRRYRAHQDEGTTVASVCLFVALIGAPAAIVGAIGLRSVVLGAVGLLLAGVFVAALTATIRHDRRNTPALTHRQGGWANRIHGHPEIAPLLQQGWWVKGYRPRNGGGSGGP
ncbi:hypothetical protein ACFC7A_16930 [Streptomyces niveus]|uniref:hypothetical protein n=1 Tax=Streptomyces niveus TaxID=193462 RepID=UPI0035D8DB95